MKEKLYAVFTNEHRCKNNYSIYKQSGIEKHANISTTT